MTQIDPKLLKQLACPACDDRPPLTETASGLLCEECGRTYPIIGGIPVMLVDEATLRPESQPRTKGLPA